jgi:hypothetical protein
MGIAQSHKGALGFPPTGIGWLSIGARHRGELYSGWRYKTVQRSEHLGQVNILYSTRSQLARDNLRWLRGCGQLRPSFGRKVGLSHAVYGCVIHIFINKEKLLQGCYSARSISCQCGQSGSSEHLRKVLARPCATLRECRSHVQLVPFFQLEPYIDRG